MKKSILILFLVFGGLFLNARCLEAITLSPPVIEVEVGKGEVGALRFKIYNDEKQAKLYYLSKGDFGAKGEDGQAEFFEEGMIDASYSLAAWISLPKNQVVLEPGQSAEVALTIQVPDDAEPGGHYGAVFFSDLPPWMQKSESSQVSIGTRIAALILARVDGEVEEAGIIEDFSLRDKKRVYSHLPIDFLVKFSNQGNVHLKPRGEIEIHNMFGRKLSQVTLVETFDEQGEQMAVEKLDFLPVNFSLANVLPHSTRKFETSWLSSSFEEKSSFLANLSKELKDFRIGQYTFDIKMRYGQVGEEATYQKISVWFFPWRLFLTILVLFVITLVIFWRVRAKK